MRIIKTYHHYWQADCWEAAGNREPFFVDHLSPEDAAFLDTLSKKFPRPIDWSPDRTKFFFMPPAKLPPPQPAMAQPDSF